MNGLLNNYQDAFDIYRKLSILSGVSECETEVNLSDPDLRILLEVMQNYSQKLKSLIQLQERHISWELAQQMAEPIFRPRPAIVAFKISDTKLGETPLKIEKHSQISILDGHYFQEMTTLADTENWLSLNGFNVDLNSNAMRIVFNVLERITLGNLLDKLYTLGVNILVHGHELEENIFLRQLHSSNIKFMEMEYFGGEFLIAKREARVELGLDVSFPGDTRIQNCVPDKLFNTFLFPELFSGFRVFGLHPDCDVLNKEEISRIELKISFKKSIFELNKLSLTVNPLFAAKLKIASLQPVLLDAKKEYTVKTTESLSESEAVFFLNEVTIGKIKGSSNEVKSGDVISDYFDTKRDSNWWLSRNYGCDKPTHRPQCTIMTNLVNYPWTQAFLSGTVIISNAAIGRLNEPVFIMERSECNEQRIPLSVIFSRAGADSCCPLYLNLASLVSINIHRKLYENTKNYVNKIIECSNPTYLVGGLSNHIGQLECISAELDSFREIDGCHEITGYKLELILNKTMHEIPNLVVFSHALARQLLEYWNASQYLCVAIFDREKNMLSELRNAF